MNNKLLIFGCGYSAQFISKRLINKGWKVFATTRSEERFKKLKGLGISPIRWDDVFSVNNLLTEKCSLLSSIAPQDLIDDGLTAVSNLLKHEIIKINCLVYLSSTGVYGDRQGGWVSEDSDVDTVTNQGKARVKAEKNWLNLAREYNIPLFVFRIAGIYGPNRSVFDRIKARKAQKIVKADQYFNRIHVDDLSGAVCTGLENPELAGIYNIADDLPSSGADVIDEATKLLQKPNLPEVNFDDAKLSTMAKSFYLESKRVSNKKLKNSLGYCLKYPTYTTGLRSLLKDRS